MKRNRKAVRFEAFAFRIRDLTPPAMEGFALALAWKASVGERIGPTSLHQSLYAAELADGKY